MQFIHWFIQYSVYLCVQAYMHEHIHTLCMYMRQLTSTNVRGRGIALDAKTVKHNNQNRTAFI